MMVVLWLMGIMKPDETKPSLYLGSMGVGRLLVTHDANPFSTSDPRNCAFFRCFGGILGIQSTIANHLSHERYTLWLVTGVMNLPWSLVITKTAPNWDAYENQAVCLLGVIFQAYSYVAKIHSVNIPPCCWYLLWIWADVVYILFFM